MNEPATEENLDSFAADFVLPSQKEQIESVYRWSREIYFSSGPGSKNKALYLGLYIGSMVKLKLSQELFYLGHQLVNSQPNDALSWYCVGCYYFCCNKLDIAHKYIKRCLKKDPQQYAGWILLGHILSQQEESEQAVAAYRSAIRLQPKKFLPLLCLGKEFIRTNNLPLAAHTLSGARTLCSTDALVLNELGVVFVRLERLSEALQFFNWSLSVVQMEQSESLVLDEGLSEDEKLQVYYNRFSKSRLSDDQICEVMLNSVNTSMRMIISNRYTSMA